jgi:hypothetical protein
MKLPKSFELFLRDEVNLNSTRVDRANETFETLTAFLKNSPRTGPLFIDTTKQGSLRQGTIIKPRKDETEFDVDLLLELNAKAGFAPRDYLQLVHDAFMDSDRYKDKVDRRGKNRCVTVAYAGDFHVDVVPATRSQAKLFIMNRETNDFEPTDGDGYARWFAQKNALTAGRLVYVVRLLKYLRDENDWPVKSILLTTLLGNSVGALATPAVYPDIPTSLALLVTQLDSWLQSQSKRPLVVNPVLPSEQFVRHWDDKSFAEFKRQFHDTRLKIDAAMISSTPEDSIDRWRTVFGDEFPLVDEDIEADARFLKESVSLGSATHARPLSDIAQREDISAKVHIQATVYDLTGRTKFRGITSGTKLPSGRAIKYIAKTNATEPYELFWQVVNTGAHATQDGGLRGNYFKGKNLKSQATTATVNWETTKYTGRHYIQCFLVRNGVCFGKSASFVIDVKHPDF